MSHNTDPERAARRHPFAIIAIVLAVVIAAIAAIWFIARHPDDVGNGLRSDEAQPTAPVTTPPAPAGDAPTTGSTQ